MSRLTWFEVPVPGGFEVRQVYGFIFGLDGRLLILEDEGSFNLPGGKPETSESLRETLARESLEEGQALIGSAEYLGYQCVEGEEYFAQVRLVALLDQLLPAAVDPSTGKQYRRMWVPYSQVNELLGWGKSGDQQVASAVASASRMGVLWDGIAMEYIAD